MESQAGRDLWRYLLHPSLLRQGLLELFTQDYAQMFF